MEVDFNADTLTMWRNKDTQGEAVFRKEGLPFPVMHFAVTLWSQKATAEIISSSSEFVFASTDSLEGTK